MPHNTTHRASFLLASAVVAIVAGQVRPTGQDGLYVLSGWADIPRAKAAGVAATVAIAGSVQPRDIDVRDLQQHLVEIGGLPEAVLAHRDSFPLPTRDIRQAVTDFGKATDPTPAGKPLAIILALGHAGDRSATPEILRIPGRLDAGVTLSHHRAAALALERHGDPAAAKPLGKPGMQGHALTALPTGGKIENRPASLREIVLARALYHRGDDHGLGRKILTQYQHDLRGLFARHAHAVLGVKPAPLK